MTYLISSTASWHIATISVLFLIVPASSQTNGKFWWLQKEPMFGDEKEGLEDLDDGNVGMNSISAGNPQDDSYVNSASNGHNYASGYSFENVYEYVTAPRPHKPENLVHITPREPTLSITQSAPEDMELAAPQASGASQPEVVSNLTTPSPDGEMFQPPRLPLDGSTDCMCVDYYLCGTDKKIITNGEGGLIDVRLSRNRQCPGLQVCCGLPEKEGNPITTAPSLSSCGIRGSGLDPAWFRILNSDDNSTVFGEFPWMLALLRAEEMEDGKMQYNLFQCGASLIHPQVALTAAHCVSSHKEEELKIRAGEWDTQTTTEPLKFQERSVSQIIKHPNYYSGALYNDIALLILDSPLEVAANVLPVCLPEENSVFDGSRCFATGWGVNGFGRGARHQTILKKVELPIIPSADCQDKLRLTRLSSFFRLHDSFVCAGGESGKDTCRGDGGGPLVCQLPNVSTYVQVGIVSWGIGCGENGIPAVYTNVPRFRNWIDGLLKNVGLYEL